MRTWVIALLLLGLGRAAGAQPLQARAYSVADGLAHDRVKRVVADSRGLLWFCTPQGLARFDGTRFTTYREAHGLPFDSVNDLLETSAGDYWIATNGAGVARVAGGTTFTAFPVGDGAPANRVNAVYEDAARRIWAGTDAGLFVLEPDGSSFRAVPLAAAITPHVEPQVWAVVESATHGILAGTGAGLLAVGRMDDRDALKTRLDDDALEASPRLIAVAGETSRSITALLAVDDRVWVGHDEGVAVLDTGAATASSRVSAGAVLALAHRDGRILAGTLAGELVAIDEHTAQVVERHMAAARSGILSIAVDRGNGLWLGTRAEGALRLLGTALVPFAEREGLPPQPVRMITESRRGDIYAVSLRPAGSLFVFDGARFAEVPAPLVAGAVPQVIQQDRRGGWWIGSAHGLAHFAPAPTVAALRGAAPRATYTARTGLPHGNVLTLFEDSAERMWVGGWAVGHATYVDARQSRVHDVETAPLGLPALQPGVFAEDHQANVWIGGRNGEIARYRRGRIEPIATPRPLRQVAGMLVDRAGRLWVASVAGLFRIDTPAADRPVLTEIPGLASSMTRFVVEDAYGRFYVGLASGVNRLDPGTGVVELYTPADGLRGAELTASLRDRTGHLWFGTHNGVTRLGPSPGVLPLPAARAYIGAVRVNGIEQPADIRGAADVGPLDLEWTRNHVAIDYFAVTFRAGETPAFRYRLEGTDTTWSAPTSATTVTYASLPPGRYRFAVEPVTAAGDGDAQPAIVSFVVHAPFWRRWWFLVSTGTALIAAAWVLYRVRLARLLAVERLRTRIATDLHDDIGASLSRIAILSEVASRRLAAPHADERQMLATIADTARGTIDAMSDIVWTIGPDRESIHDLTQRMREFASDQLAARGIDFVFDTPPAGVQQALELTMRRELLLIFKEAITNSARHSGATLVRAALALHDGVIRLEVADDGRGFAPEGAAHRDGNGLGNMAKRAAALGGTLTVDSSDRGTSIGVTAPLHGSRGQA